MKSLTKSIQIPQCWKADRVRCAVRRAVPIRSGALLRVLSAQNRR
jgi:hypothetical protein